MLTLLLLTFAQTPQHRLFLQPNLPSGRPFTDGFEAFAADGRGTNGQCSTTPPVGYLYGAPVTLTTTRGTVAECYSNDGQSLTQLAVDLPRVSSGTASSSVVGAWKERTAINSFKHSRDLSHSDSTKTNMTCVHTANGMRGGDANGATACMATANNATVCQSITYAASTNNTSFHLKRRNGSAAVTVARDGATYSSDLSASLSSTLWRRVVSQEAPGCAGGNCIVVAGMTSGIANPTICLKIALAGDSVDIDFVQDEGGAVATSPIETAGSAVQRDGDILDFAMAFSPTVAGGGFSMSATMVSALSFTGGSTTIPLVLGNGTLGSTAGPATYAWLYSINSSGLVGFDTANVVSSGTATLNQMWTNFGEIETAVAGYHTGAAINSCQRGVCALASASTLGTPAFTRLLLGRYSGSSGTNHLNGVIKNIIVGPGSVAIPTPQTGPIVWIGDSIIFGNGSMPMTPPVYLTQLSGRGVVAAGVGGNTVAQCGARWTSTYKARGYQTLVWSCAVNDLAVGTNGATLATAAQVFLAEARAEGMKVIITQVTPWKNSTGWSAATQTQTAAYNSSMSTWATNNGATYVSTASMGGQGGDPDLLLSTMESSAADKIHTNALGASTLATLVNGASP